MSNRCLWRTARAAFFLIPLTATAADPLENLPFNIAGGAPNLDVRTRYESVEQDSMAASAYASTVRARVGYTTGKWNAFDVQLEYEGATTLGSSHFNSSENGRITYPMVADPDFNELNQAWIRYTGLPSTTLKYGRQRLVFDNQRFVGNVGWRQNEQTYDAFSLSSTIIPRVTFDYAWISNVNAFRFFDFDPDPAATSLDDDIDVKGHYVRAAVAVVEKKLTVTPYALFLDFDEVPAPTLAREDTRTLGARVTGAMPVAMLSWSYALEYAQQKDYEDASDAVDADYQLIETGLAYQKGKGPSVKGAVGLETLGGDGTYSFQTPLATLHAFQGWADQFLVTPAGGIEDLYASLGGTYGKASLTAVYHDYQSDEGSVDYGTEINLLASYAVIDNLTIGAKYADYDADEFPVAGTPAAPFDTTKLWVWADYKF